ncbi:chaplin [Streptomyces sp. HSW2009]|uniref:chaplin n=1 Tax=Streptomyces sp. HSW2009 TaxID=3142890 RepID=UPI0032F05CC1
MRQVAKKGLITMAAAGGVLAVAGGYAQADSAASGATTSSPGVLSGNNVQVPIHIPLNACGNTVDVVGALNPAAGNRCANVDGSGTTGNAKPGKTPGKTAPGKTAPGKTTPGGTGKHTVPGQTAPRPGGVPAQGTQSGGALAQGGAHGSPGVGSGNNLQVPLHVPVNACGNTINVIGLLNPALGNKCANDAGPVVRETPPQPPEREEVTPPKPKPKPEPKPEGKPRPEPAPKPEPVKPPHAEQPPGPWVQTPPQTETHMERGPELPASRSERPAEDLISKATDQLAATGAGSLAIALPASAGLLLAGTVLYRRSRAA